MKTLPVILALEEYPVQIMEILGVGNVIHVNRLCVIWMMRDLFLSLNYFSGNHRGTGR